MVDSPQSGVRIAPDAVETLLRGLSVMGGGGGGRYNRARRTYERLGRPVRTAVPIDSVPDDATLVTAFGLGPVSTSTDRAYERTLSRFVDCVGRPDGVVLGEAGPDLLPEALAVAERFDCALVDADVAGLRCVPCISHELVEGTAVDRTPLVTGDTVIDSDYTGAELEARLRTDHPRFIVGYPNPTRVVRNAVATGTLSLAAELGRAVGSASLTERSEARLVAAGRVQSVDRRRTGGFSVSELTVDAGEETYTVVTKNETVAVTVDGDPVASMPEIITLVDVDRRIGLSTAAISDQQVRIVALEEYDCWDGSPSLTPRRVGVDIGG